MKTFPVEISFKGNRPYLRGGDLYTALMETLPRAKNRDAGGPVNMKFSRLPKHQVLIVLAEKEDIPPVPANLVASFSAMVNGVRHLGWFVESDRPVKCREDFDEQEIMRVSEIQGESIAISGGGNLAAVDVVVSITKRLHDHIYPDEEKSWILTALDIHRPLQPHDTDGIIVVLERSLGRRLTKSRIVAGGKELGHIFFSLVSL